MNILEEHRNENKYYTDIISGITERTIKRLWIVIILLIVLLVATNGMWIYYESQWQVVETTTVEAEQESDTGNNYAVVGDIYGETESKGVKDKVPAT